MICFYARNGDGSEYLESEKLLGVILEGRFRRVVSKVSQFSDHRHARRAGLLWVRQNIFTAKNQLSAREYHRTRTLCACFWV